METTAITTKDIRIMGVLFPKGTEVAVTGYAQFTWGTAANCEFPLSVAGKDYRPLKHSVDTQWLHIAPLKAQINIENVQLGEDIEDMQNYSGRHGL